MKKNNNAKKGFGFGDALFGMKQLQFDYQNISKKQEKVQEVQQKIQKKPVVNRTNPNKPTVLKKQPIKSYVPKQPVKQNLSVQQTKNNNTNTFKINAGKQYQTVQMVKFIPCLVQQHVTQLTVNGKPTNWQFNVFCDGIPTSAFIQNPMVGFNFGATDIFQGNLGNCYFIASVASMSNHPKILRERIPNCKKYNGTQKTYKVNLFQSGKSVDMLVQNLFTKVYSQPVQNDISTMIIEKAYAQLYGNYEIINKGFSADSLRDLTGAPSQYLQLKNKTQVKNTLDLVFKEKYPAVIDTNGQVYNQHLSPKHSYIVIDYKLKNNDVFLKIRDPRARSMQSMVMPMQVKNSISDEQKQNGIFWANFNTIRDNFKVLAYSKVKYGYQYFYKTFKQNQLTNHQASIILNITQPTIAHFSCHQKHKKFFDKNYNYKILRLLIGSVQINQGKIKPKQLIQSNFNVKPACHISCQLLPGKYVMMGGIGNGRKVKSPQQAITFSIYTNNPNIQFTFAKNYTNAQPFIQNYMQKNINLFKQSISDKKLCRYFGPLYGYMCLFYNNQSKRQVLQMMTYTVENIEIRQKKVSLRVDQKKLLMHPIGEQNNCSHKFAFKTQTNYKG